MTEGISIDEAIKELQIMNHDGFIITRDTELKALKLGEEALKRVKNNRGKVYTPVQRLLPGETEE
jgi:hypothetical protein